MTRLISLAPATQGAPDSLRDHPLNDNNHFRDALSNALASSSLGLREFGNGGEHDLSDCISQVFVHGKLPPGNSCVGMVTLTLSLSLLLFSELIYQTTVHQRNACSLSSCFLSVFIVMLKGRQNRLRN
jgi:hypothetical protein